MSKRPSCLALTEDTIFCADKFGDVYSLPLLPTEEADKAAKQAALAALSKPIAPAASESTVHSQSNLKKLEQQRKNMQNPQQNKEQMMFAHKMLLGHVSLATGLLFADVKSDDGTTKQYIITSDRDEHIRVSRGPEQTYVIENFCFGHKEFVSSLCMVSPDILVSGGGDDHLFVWDWLKGAARAKHNLVPAMKKVLSKLTIPNNEQIRIAVSGLWAFKEKVSSRFESLTNTGPNVDSLDS
jgi:tRNA (guanine-N(7)-)-methyltransferase subunit TRM82